MTTKKKEPQRERKDVDQDNHLKAGQLLKKDHGFELKTQNAIIHELVHPQKLNNTPINWNHGELYTSKHDRKTYDRHTKQNLTAAEANNTAVFYKRFASMGESHKKATEVIDRANKEATKDAHLNPEKALIKNHFNKEFQKHGGPFAAGLYKDSAMLQQATQFEAAQQVQKHHAIEREKSISKNLSKKTLNKIDRKVDHEINPQGHHEAKHINVLNADKNPNYIHDMDFKFNNHRGKNVIKTLRKYKTDNHHITVAHQKAKSKPKLIAHGGLEKA